MFIVNNKEAGVEKYDNDRQKNACKKLRKMISPLVMVDWI